MTNTVTVNAKDQSGDAVPPSTDTAVTNLLKPGIAIDKTGPATATAGDLVTYKLEVTNTGNTAFADGLVVLADALCQAPPALLSKNGDASPGTLSPGETLDLLLPGATQAGQQQVVNIGSVKGTDQGGRKVAEPRTRPPPRCRSRPRARRLPETAGRPALPGQRALRGTVACATAQYARAAISGHADPARDLHVNGRSVRR